MSASVRAASRTDVGAGRTRWRGKDRTARPLPVRRGCVAIACVCWASCGIASTDYWRPFGSVLEVLGQADLGFKEWVCRRVAQPLLAYPPTDPMVRRYRNGLFKTDLRLKHYPCQAIWR